MLMNDISFSIVIPVYNSEKYIHRTIKSIINQSYEKFEAIFIDDYSIDLSFDVIMKYKEKDSRIKLFKNNKKGVSSARNLGIEYSSNDYIIFLDADDFLEKNCKKYCIYLLRFILKRKSIQKKSFL